MLHNSTRRWLVRCGAASGAAIAVIAAVFWWQARSLDSAEDQLAAGNAAAALAAIDAHLAVNPDDSQALALRGRALVALGRAEEAALLFERAGAAELDDLRAWSTALLLLGRRDEALPILERMLQLEPENPQTLTTAAICQLELGRRGQSAATARRLAELPGHEAIGNFYAASIYREWGYPSLANEHFRKVLQFRPDATGLSVDSSDFFLAYGDSLLAEGNARRALEALQRCSDLKFTAEVANRQAAAWLLIGDYEQAQRHYQQALAESPDSRTAREGLAEAALAQGEPETAIEWLTPLVEADRLTADTAYLLQRAHTDAGHDAAAQQWQQQTARLRMAQRRLAALVAEARQDPQAPRALLVFAHQAAVDGDWTSASRFLADLLRQSPLWYDTPFVQAMIEAVRQRSAPPPIESFPDAQQSDSP